MPRMCCSLRRLIVLTLSPPPPVWTFPRSPPGTSTSTMTREILAAKRRNCAGENWPVILPEIATSTSIQGSFTCRKHATWDPRLYFPSEGRRAEDFFVPKNLGGFGPGSNPQTWVLKGSTLPPDRRNRLAGCLRTFEQNA